MKVCVHQDYFVATHSIHSVVLVLTSCIHDVCLPILGFELFAAIVVVYPLLVSAREISAEPRLTPVAHFLATGSYVIDVRRLSQSCSANHLDHCPF